MPKRPVAFMLTSFLLAACLLGSIVHMLSNDFDFRNSADTCLAVLVLCSGSLLALAALGTWRPRPWGYFALASAVFAVTILDTIAAHSDGFSIFFLPDLVLVGSGVLILWDKKSRALFFNSSLRWWETARRFVPELPITTYSKSDDAGVEIINMSTTGCLIASNKTYEIGDTLELQLSFDFWLGAKIIRKSRNNYGLNFTFKNWKERRKLKSFLTIAKKKKLKTSKSKVI